VRSLKKILIVEDDEIIQDGYAGLLNGFAEVLQAKTIQQAGIFLTDKHEDVALMVFDGNVPWEPEGNFGTTVSLIAGIRAGGTCDGKFTGPMIATSSSKRLLAEQIVAGCDYACPKKNVPELVKLLISKLV